jgi:hypothetical protein
MPRPPLPVQRARLPQDDASPRRASPARRRHCARPVIASSAAPTSPTWCADPPIAPYRGRSGARTGHPGQSVTESPGRKRNHAWPERAGLCDIELAAPREPSRRSPQQLRTGHEMFDSMGAEAFAGRARAAGHRRDRPLTRRRDQRAAHRPRGTDRATCQATTSRMPRSEPGSSSARAPSTITSASSAASWV